MIDIPLQTFTTFVWAWIGLGALIFPVQFFITAPYGRHTKTTWGPMIDNRLGWFIMEVPSLLLFSWFVIAGGGLLSNPIAVFFGLWFIHYFHRSIIFPLRLKTRKKKMPWLIMSFAFTFNLVNGFINGYWFGYLTPGYDNSWFLDPRFITGALLFVTGFAINQYHDKLLLGLRKNSNGEYQIPYGGLFRYVSCPNFFGEIIEWAGFALMTWCLPSFAFFFWTFINLIPRAVEHHKWYRNHFDEYPAARKAVFPFIL